MDFVPGFAGGLNGGGESGGLSRGHLVTFHDDLRGAELLTAATQAQQQDREHSAAIVLMVSAFRSAQAYPPPYGMGQEANGTTTAGLG